MSLFKISCVTFSSLGPVSHPEKGKILRRSCLVISFTLFYTVLQCFTLTMSLCPGNILATTHYWKVLVSSSPPYIRSWWQTSEFKSHGSCILSWTVPYFYNILHCLGDNTWFLYPLLNSSIHLYFVYLQYIGLFTLWCSELTLFLYPLLNSVTQYIALLELWNSDSKSHASSASCRHLSSQQGAWDIICSELQYVKRLPAICQGS